MSAKLKSAAGPAFTGSVTLFEVMVSPTGIPVVGGSQVAVMFPVCFKSTNVSVVLLASQAVPPVKQMFVFMFRIFVPSGAATADHFPTENHRLPIERKAEA